ncbi:MAG: prolyl oligopeptidase family serine peptidase [Planctomycetaceae bacterium]
MAASAGLADEPAASTVAEVYEAKVFKSPQEGSQELKYRLLIPEGYDVAQETRFPLVLFLHGAGERGADNRRQLIHGAAQFSKPEHRKKHACFVAAPQCPSGRWWTDSLEPVMELVRQLQADYRIDPERLYVTGLSMGGFGTFELTTRYPDVFAAAAPICGGGDPTKAKSLSALPLWVFHGDADRVVPVGFSRSMVKAIEAAGGKPKYTEYPGVGHDCWTATYADPDFHEWLFAQKRPR